MLPRRPSLGVTFYSHARELALHPTVINLETSDVAHPDSVAGIRRRILAGEMVDERNLKTLSDFIQRWDGKTGYVM